MININIDDVSIVSFDIFDTLILRMVEKPTDIFRLVQIEYEKKYGPLNFNYEEIRIESENEARKIAYNNENRLEIHFDEIFEALINLLIDKEKIDILKELELNLEKKFCVPNNYMKKLFNECKKMGKKILIVSDMYLDKDIILSLLDKCGYSGYENLYLSSELMMTKAHGGVYDYIIKELKVNPNDILHIGDNYETDIGNAKKRGIKTYYYQKCAERAEKLFISGEKSIALSIAKATIYNNMFCNIAIEEREDFWYQFGFKYVGILYYALVTWIQRNAKKDNVDYFLFLARDGYILKKVYDIIYENSKNKINSQYVFASRRAFVLPTMKDNFEKMLEFLITSIYEIKVNDYIDRIGLKAENYENEIRLAGFSSKEDFVVGDGGKKKIVKFFEMISSDINEIAMKEYEILVKYIKQLNIEEYDKVGVVDIGYNGTMQNALKQIIENENIEKELIGYYFATYKSVGKYEKKDNIYNGFLLQREAPINIRDIFWKGVEVVEYIFTAPHQSVQGFYEKNCRIYPKFEDNKYIMDYVDNLKKLQKGAIDYIKVFIKYVDIELEVEPSTAFEPLSRVLLDPTLEEAEAFGEIIHTEGFGKIVNLKYIAKPNYVDGITSKNELMNQYKNAYWKKGFLKRLPKDVVTKYFSQYEDLNLQQQKYFDIMNDLAIAIKKKAIDKVIIYGAGDVGRAAIKAFKANNIDIECIVDRNENLWGSYIEGIKVESIDNACFMKTKAFVVSSFAYSKEISKLINIKEKEYKFKANIFCLRKNE
ncbi:HAD family hydrolase [Clostridium beijerinckii]|uniref:HAD family hydrolase n=1 Tax=Clostridium beijerinckii TaxID=1520 RepID=UPI00156F3109|nr:HAD family hydrolase [Clostridium beijerinckii]NRT73687.1 putative HAD superfamily hydrolase [Clostridium beijerinckii]